MMKYPGEMVVDQAKHIIVVADLTNIAADRGQLSVMLQAVETNLGEQPEQALADTGYRNKAAFKQLHEVKTELIVTLGCEGKEQA